MKKKLIITIIGIITVLLALIIIIFNLTGRRKENVYKEYKIDNCKFKVLEEYKYKFDKDKKRGYLDNSIFLKSYIYISNKKYKDLISLSAYYEDMGGNEIDSDVEETKFGDYSVFINTKEVEYDDVEEHDYLVIILVKLDEDRTFVFQYEINSKNNKDEILNNIKEGLKNIEEK